MIYLIFLVVFTVWRQSATDFEWIIYCMFLIMLELSNIKDTIKKEKEK